MTKKLDERPFWGMRQLHLYPVCCKIFPYNEKRKAKCVMIFMEKIRPLARDRQMISALFGRF
jgi:hypothetical protein